MLETKINHSISRITGLFGTRREECWEQRLTIVYHVLLDRLGQDGGSDSVGGTAVLSLYHYYLWPFCGSTTFAQTVLAALQGCHFMITSPGLSVAQQLLVTLYPSLRPALSVVLEVDSYDDSRGRAGHVRRFSR